MSEVKLSKQQEAFAQEIIKGKTQADAYRIAYPTSKKWKVDAIYSQASILMNNSKIVERLEELRKPIKEKLEKKAIYTIEQAFEEYEIAKQLAIATNNANALNSIVTNKCKMAGLEPPSKQEINGNLGIKKVFITKEDINKADDLIDKELE